MTTTSSRKRRGRAHNGRGSFTQHNDGTWSAYVSMGKDPVTGARIRKHVRGGSFDEAYEEYMLACRQRDAGKTESSTSVTTGRWLLHWLTTCRDAGESANTIARKEWAIHNWLIEGRKRHRGA